MSAETKKYLRDVSLWSVEMLEKMGLNLFFDKAAGLSDEAARAQVAALIWCHHVDVPEDAVEAAVETGEWVPAVRAFKRNPAALWAMPEVFPTMDRVRDILSGFDERGKSGDTAPAEA